MAKDRLPLGIRNNNPGNIEWGSPWEGLVPRGEATLPDGKRFCQFKDAPSGIRAIVRTLITYADKRVAADGSAIDTVWEVIARWAPPSENNTPAYVSQVARVVGVGAHDPINIKDYAVMRALVVGIIAHENAGYAYPDAVIDEGMRRAGMVQPKSLVNTATVAGAATPAAVGLATLVPLAQPLADAVKAQQDNLTSGEWFKVGVGLLLVACALTVAWAQWKKHQAGAL